MTLKAQADFNSGDTREKVDKLLARIESLYKEVTTNPDKLRELIDNYYTLVEQLGVPVFTPQKLDPRETATFQKLNEIFQAIEEDMLALFRAYRGLHATIGRTYNRAHAMLLGTEGELKNVTAQALTAALQANLPQRGMFVAVDMFTDDTKQDDATTADTGFGGGSLTLQKIEVFPADIANAKITIAADNTTPSKSTTTTPGIKETASAVDLDPRYMTAYEGRYYAYLGEGEFEGGRLKLITTPDGQDLVPAETPAELLLKSRKVILDGAVDTYHQVERVVITSVDEVDPGQLDANYPYDFSVQYTIDFAKPVRGTAVVLDPINFGERAWLEIRVLETSIDGQEWESIPGLFNYNYYNILTDEANTQLNEDQSNALLASNKYAYSGKGVWVFGTREFRYLRMVILQRTPILQPYEIIRLTQQRTVSKTTTPPKVLGIKLGKKKTKVTNESRSLELSYGESLAAYGGDQVVDTDLGSYRSDEGLDISILGKNLFSSGGTTVEKSAWQTTDSSTIVKNNIIRYAIGIRELEVLVANYAPSSVYVSKPFRVPSPIRQIQLRANHFIAEELGEGSYIKYFVSLDGGNNWARIGAIDYPPEYDVDGRVPTVIQVNSNTPIEAQDDRFGYVDTGAPAYSVQVKIELSRPQTDEGITPIVNRYALEILTRETIDV